MSDYDETDEKVVLSAICTLVKEVAKLTARVEELERLVVNARVGLNIPLGG